MLVALISSLLLTDYVLSLPEPEAGFGPENMVTLSRFYIFTILCLRISLREAMR